MPCNACRVQDLKFEVSFKNYQQPALIQSVDEHLKRSDMLVRII